MRKPLARALLSGVATALLACSGPTNTPVADGSSCQGSSCDAGVTTNTPDAMTSDAPVDAGAQDATNAGDTSTSDGPAADAFMPGRFPLCPDRGPIVGPLPSGVSMVHDYKVANDVAHSVVATDSSVFWSNRGVIHRVNLNDNSDVTLVDHSAPGQTIAIVDIAVDVSNNLFFTESGMVADNPLGLATVAAGSNFPKAVLNAPNAGVLAVAGGYVYFEDTNITGPVASSIVRIPTTGGPTTTLVRDVPGGLGAIAVGGGYVYFMVQHTHSTNLLRIPVTAIASGSDGGAGDAGVPDASALPIGVEVVANTGLNTFGPVTDATNVYWGDEDKLMKAPLAGGPPTMVVQAPALGGQFASTNSVIAIAASGGSLYWSYGANCPGLIKGATDGTQQSTIVANTNPLKVALNSTKAFFVAGMGQILSVAR